MDVSCDADSQVRLGTVFVTSIGGRVGWSALSDARAKSAIRKPYLRLAFVRRAARRERFRYTSGNARPTWVFVAQEIEMLFGDGDATAARQPDSVLRVLAPRAAWRAAAVPALADGLVGRR